MQMHNKALAAHSLVVYSDKLPHTSVKTHIGDMKSGPFMTAGCGQEKMHSPLRQQGVDRTRCTLPCTFAITNLPMCSRLAHPVDAPCFELMPPAARSRAGEELLQCPQHRDSLYATLLPLGTCCSEASGFSLGSGGSGRKRKFVLLPWKSCLRGTLGAPGSPGREYCLANDPDVAS